MFRAYLRAEIAERLRELAKTEPVELACSCGQTVEVSPSYFEKVRRGSVPAPLCFECKRPKQVAQADAEAVRFVETLGDQAGELAVAVAALR